MQIKVNRNHHWANVFFDQLAECGVKYACISPGSRSTPLTYSLSQNKRIKSYVIIDERTSGFFALGIAKKNNTPVILVTTSGTATAELYPAIIEAYQNRVPLIICTADRPAYLRNTGANQTINQNDLYKNHIRFFYDTGLPVTKLDEIKKLKDIAIKSFSVSMFDDCGPVHINFPFEKPLEPQLYTDKIDVKFINGSLPKKNIEFTSALKTNNKIFPGVYRAFEHSTNGLIIVGPGNFSDLFIDLLEEFSVKLGLPVFADATSGLRFHKKKLTNLICNYDSILRNYSLTKYFSPDFVFHFGRTPTSLKLEENLLKVNAKTYIINRHGDLFDTSRKASVIKANEEEFIKDILMSAKYHRKIDTTLLKFFRKLDNDIEKLKLSFFEEEKTLSEPNVLITTLNALPKNSNLMIGNSVPIRDLDFFASVNTKNINIFQNRGASGIDGITSTALGIAANNKQPTFLITGDLSFYHDLNSLLIAKQFKISLTIILINNNGGGLFNFLPIAKQKNIFKEYFRTPTNLSFEKLVKAFGIEYKEIKNLKKLYIQIGNFSGHGKTSVIEVKTDSKKSLTLRKRFWLESRKCSDKLMRNYET